MQIIDLDIGSYQVPQTVYAKQGDVGRKFQIHLADGGEPYVPADGAWFSLWYSGTSGIGNYSAIADRSAFSQEGSAVTVELIGAMLRNKGGGTLCLLLHDEQGAQTGFWNIPYVCEAVPGLDSSEVTAHCTALTEYARMAAESAAAAQEAAESFQVDSNLVMGGMAADAAETGRRITEVYGDIARLGREKMPVKMYSYQSITVNADTPTEKFWERIRHIYAAQEVESVRYLSAEVEVGFAEYGEPAAGSYRVIMTKGRTGNGFVQIEGTVEDVWGAPQMMTAFFRDGIWSAPIIPANLQYSKHFGYVLWENSSPYTEFWGGTVELGYEIAYYNTLVIDFNFSTEYGYKHSVVLHRYETESAGGVAFFPAGTANGVYVTEPLSRSCSWNDRQLTFDDAYRGETRNNTMVIPVRVYATNM